MMAPSYKNADSTILALIEALILNYVQQVPAFYNTNNNLSFLEPMITGKNNGFPFLDILEYLKNTHKNPKFGRVRQVSIRELGWEFPGWDLSHFAKFGIFMGIL